MTDTVDAPAPSLLPPPRQSTRSNTWRVLATMFLAGGFGAVAGLKLGRMASAAAHSVTLTPLDALGVLVTIVGVIFLHEVGHVVGGLLGGMRFMLLTTGPLSISRDGDRLRLRFNNSVNLWGGIAVMLPTSMERFTQRIAVMIAGGPAASLLLAGIGAAIAASSDGRAAFHGMVLAVMSFGIFLVTIIPMNAGGFVSDGGQLLALRRQDAGATLRAMITSMASASMTGTRPRDSDEALLAQALASDGPAPLRTVVQLLAALREVDAGRDAAPHFDAMMRLYPELAPGQRQGVALWIAWHHAAVRGDAETAEAWKAEAVGGLVEPLQRDMVDAVIAHARGDAGAARAAAERGLARGPGMDPGGAKLMKRSWSRCSAALGRRSSRRERP